MIFFSTDFANYFPVFLLFIQIYPYGFVVSAFISVKLSAQGYYTGPALPHYPHYLHASCFCIHFR